MEVKLHDLRPSVAQLVSVGHAPDTRSDWTAERAERSHDLVPDVTGGARDEDRRHWGSLRIGAHAYRDRHQPRRYFWTLYASARISNLP